MHVRASWPPPGAPKAPEASKICFQRDRLRDLEAELARALDFASCTLPRAPPRPPSGCAAPRFARQQGVTGWTGRGVEPIHRARASQRPVRNSLAGTASRNPCSSHAAARRPAVVSRAAAPRAAMPLRLDIKRKLSSRSDRVKSVDIHPTEPWVLSAMYNGHVFLWNYNTQTLVK